VENVFGGRNVRFLIPIYLLVALLTFGYTFNADYEESKNPSWVSTEEINLYNAFGCGMFWPMYWTVKAFKPLRP
jgi:hypothetical protein